MRKRPKKSKSKKLSKHDSIVDLLEHDTKWNYDFTIKTTELRSKKGWIYGEIDYAGVKHNNKTLKTIIDIYEVKSNNSESNEHHAHSQLTKVKRYLTLNYPCLRGSDKEINLYYVHGSTEDLGYVVRRIEYNEK